MTWALFEGIDASAQTQVVVYSAGLCLLSLSWRIGRLRPDKISAQFYLMIAAGALEGLFVAVIAPLIFTVPIPLSLLSCASFFSVCL